MTFVDMEAAALLVGEEGFDLEPAAIVSAGLVGVGHIGDQIDWVFVTAAPPADQVQGKRCILSEANLVAPKDLTLGEWKVSNWLAALTFRIMAPPACQEAAFHKYRSSNARSIIDGVTLDIKNHPGGHGTAVPTVIRSLMAS